MTRFGSAFVCTGQTEEHSTDKEISDPRLKRVLFKLLITCSLINKTKEESTKMLNRHLSRFFASQLYDMIHLLFDLD